MPTDIEPSFRVVASLGATIDAGVARATASRGVKTISTLAECRDQA